MGKFSQCLVCGEFDTDVDNGDCRGCSECGAIEQGFLWLEEDENGIVTDENGVIYDL